MTYKINNDKILRFDKILFIVDLSKQRFFNIFAKNIFTS